MLFLAMPRLLPIVWTGGHFRMIFQRGRAKCADGAKNVRARLRRFRFSRGKPEAQQELEGAPSNG
jgi:hypothetical protein